MGLVKLFKLGPNGIARQHTTTADEINFLSGQFGNLKLAANSLTSEDTDGDIILDPNGSGLVNINNAYTLPGADGSANDVLTTDGAGAVTFQPTQAASEANKICNDYTADEALATNDALYISAADNVSKADASAEATARVIGFAKAGVADLATVSVCHDGILSGFSGLTPGARMFLSETAGLITSTVPSTDEAAVVQVGYAKSATELHIDIEVIAEIEDD